MNAVDRAMIEGMPPGRMEEQAARLRAGKARLGMTTGQLARLWSVRPETLRDWLSGRAPIPGSILRLVELEQPAPEMPGFGKI
jgi:DNA-binding transcriptional regulator YiaG